MAANATGRSILVIVLLAAALMLSGCGLLFGGEPEQTPTPARPLVPTFTPTPVGQAPTATPAPPTPMPVVETATETPKEAPAQEPAGQEQGSPQEATAAPEPSPTPKAILVVTQDLANVRSGPGLDFGLAGSVNKDQQLDIVAKNAAGDWWQVCCVNGQTVWIFSQLVRTENAENVPVAEDLPEPVVQVQPPAATPAPQQPTNTPEPPTPAPPPAADPCANIGGDGCKFRVTAGPKFLPNGGGELKLTLAFIHSGIDGGQPQGSYFVVLLKDGQNLNVPDSVRSFDPSIAMRESASGRYNYEYKIPLDQLPGNNVAGNYTIWVLDGNGERDSKDFSFSVPEGQGEVWMTFDQG
jgi:hypothetical protein